MHRWRYGAAGVATALSLYGGVIAFAPKAFADYFTFTQSCVLTQIYQPGYGWVSGSERLDCDVSVRMVYTGAYAQLGGGGSGSLSGGDSGGGELSDELACEVEQAAERDLDNAAQEAAAKIRAKPDQSKEHGTLLLELNGRIIALKIQTGDEDSITGETWLNMFEEMRALGLNESHIRGMIHSHPPLPSDHEWAGDQSFVADDNFVNSFPSQTDYTQGYSALRMRAALHTTDIATWESQFRAYIVAPDGSLREFEGFSQPDHHNFNNGVPPTGSTERGLLENELAAAQADAENRCLG